MEGRGSASLRSSVPPSPKRRSRPATRPVGRSRRKRPGSSSKWRRRASRRHGPRLLASVCSWIQPTKPSRPMLVRPLGRSGRDTSRLPESNNGAARGQLRRLHTFGRHSMMVVAIFGGLVGLMVIGVPIAISLALTAAATMYWMGGADLMIMLAQRMYASTTSFPLLAIPFFIFAGNLMNTGGMTHRLFAVAHMLVGRIHGGLGQVNVLASMLFAGMSGSAVADAVGLGKIEIEAMRQAGYSTRFAAAISAVSSTIGPVIPPSIPFVIYGSLANVSVGALFLAGVIPGVLMGVAMMIAIAIIARYRDLPLSEARPPLRVAAALLGDAVPALMMPFIVIGGIL